MKKRTGIILFGMVMMLSITTGAYAATDEVAVTYLPGTADTVANMPNNTSVNIVNKVQLPSLTPEREGFEFLGWKLDFDTFETAAVTYQVYGDPIYGKPDDAIEPKGAANIRLGSTIALPEKLTTSWQTKDGSAPSSSMSCTVNYLDAEQHPVAPKKEIPNLGAGTIQEEALIIEGYKVVGEEKKSIEIQPDYGSWTFTGWCSDEACTNPIAEIEGITGDTTVYGRWSYSEIEHENEITFTYEKKLQYVVYYVDMNLYYALGLTEEAMIASPKTGYADQGEWVSECPVFVEEYMAPPRGLDQIIYDGQKIIFSYISLKY